jgi:hypothetical protein
MYLLALFNLALKNASNSSKLQHTSKVTPSRSASPALTYKRDSKDNMVNSNPRRAKPRGKVTSCRLTEIVVFARRPITAVLVMAGIRTLYIIFI